MLALRPKLLIRLRTPRLRWPRRLLTAGMPHGRNPIAAAVAARKQKNEQEHARNAAGLGACSSFDPRNGWHEFPRRLGRRRRSLVAPIR
jgi:hypothetical protein